MLDQFDLEAMREGNAISNSLYSGRGKPSRHKVTNFSPKPKRVKRSVAKPEKGINKLLEYLKQRQEQNGTP